MGLSRLAFVFFGACLSAVALQQQRQQRPLGGRGVLRSATPSNRLFLDQQDAMARRAEIEKGLLAARAQELEVPPPTIKKQSKTKKRRAPAKAGVGFGAAVTALETKATASAPTLDRAATLATEGVCLVRSAIQRSTAQALRAAVVAEIDDARAAVKLDPSTSMSRFHAVEEQQNRSFVLMPLFDSGPIDAAVRELLEPGSPLGDLWSQVCDGGDSQLYDFYALRTEPGSKRQNIHFDTPHQKTPALFAAFIALQDVTVGMGPTIFIPKSHKQTPARLEFDSRQDDRRDKMLSECDSKYALLGAGDATIFDMRTLHAGASNTLEFGSTRYFLCVTFRNLNAKESLGHQACIRPGYKKKLTLKDCRDQLKLDRPFESLGQGLQ